MVARTFGGLYVGLCFLGPAGAGGPPPAGTEFADPELSFLGGSSGLPSAGRVGSFGVDEAVEGGGVVSLDCE